jgi:penicillin-binding protein 1A
VANDMNMMLSKVVEEGTARRAQLEGIRAAGKTGTTNAHRDAWFVGYTGNFVAGVWFGNDDYATMHQMTGGSLPAITWQAIMSYAHHGVELKPIRGLGPQGPGRAVAAETRKEGPQEAGRHAVLTKRGTEALLRVERLMDDAVRALVARSAPSKTTDAQGASAHRPETFASASDQQPQNESRGN